MQTPLFSFRTDACQKEIIFRCVLIIQPLYEDSVTKKRKINKIFLESKRTECQNSVLSMEKKSLPSLLLRFVIFEKLVEIARDHTVIELLDLVRLFAVQSFEALVRGDNVYLPWS